MNKVIFIILRRMRAPLLVLIAAYTISILGLVLIPGVDENGQPWRMDFFHAFYFVSYMATTIGFGELPYQFSDAQRLWTIISIYLSVITWLYAIGKILALVQDPTFKQAVAENSFTRGIRSLKEPFYIVCGYGETGSLLVSAMAQRGMRAVVIDHNPDRISELEVEDLDVYVPGLCEDAAHCDVLKEAGLLHRRCIGVIALTDNDEVNLKIAITTKLLNPDLLAICRAESHDAEANMASFGTDHIINPFDTFGDRLALALHSPSNHLLHDWLTGVPNTPLVMPLYPPHGRWVLCGYGRFGKAVSKNMQVEGVLTTIIEANPEGTGCVQCIFGRGTEADTLLEAGIDTAAGVVAGTDNDANNLSIIMTAAEINSDLFMVARQNQRENDDIFHAAKLDLVMQRSDIIARTILSHLTTPLLANFLRLMRIGDVEWANELVSRISAVTEKVPEVWTVNITERDAPAVYGCLMRGEEIRLIHLESNAVDRQLRLPSIALLLARKTGDLLTPDEELSLCPGDQLLFCGPEGTAERMRWVLQNANALSYVRTGEEKPDGYIWRWLSRHGT